MLIPVLISFQMELSIHHQRPQIYSEGRSKQYTYKKTANRQQSPLIGSK
jgi:hypothetical protein